MSIKLKVKTKSLAEEAKIIRKEERKALSSGRYLKNKQEPTEASKSYSLYRSLNDHRRKNVRDEARATFIARAYLRGDSYDRVENVSKSENKEERYYNNYPIFKRALKIINKYNEKSDIKDSDFKEWITK